MRCFALFWKEHIYPIYTLEAKQYVKFLISLVDSEVLGVINSNKHFTGSCKSAYTIWQKWHKSKEICIQVFLWQKRCWNWKQQLSVRLKTLRTLIKNVALISPTNKNKISTFPLQCFFGAIVNTHLSIIFHISLFRFPTICQALELSFNVSIHL